jgi:hypothetical protein
MTPNARRTAARERAAHPWRLQLCQEIGKCEACGRHKRLNEIACHEIASGTGLRQKALTARFAILVLCWECHPKVQIQSKAKQLARLYLNRQADYSLELYWQLTSRRYPEQEDVDAEIENLLGDVEA